MSSADAASALGSTGKPNDWVRRRRKELQVFLYAFVLLELDGADMRREPIEVCGAEEHWGR